MPERFDPRPLHRQIQEGVVVWTYILGLSTLLLVWSLVAWAAIGSGTRTLPNYNLPNTTPASKWFSTFEVPGPLRQ